MLIGERLPSLNNTPHARQVAVTPACVSIPDARLRPAPRLPPGVIAKPKVACRLGVDAAFKSRVGTVGVPVTKIPGVVDFLEGIVNKALTANLVWPRADVRDMDSYERDRSQPGTGRLRVQVLGAEALPPEKVKATAETMAKAEKEAAVAPPSPSKPARDGSAAGYRVAAAKFSSGVFDCTVKWFAGETNSPTAASLFRSLPPSPVVTRAAAAERTVPPILAPRRLSPTSPTRAGRAGASGATLRCPLRARPRASRTPSSPR